MWVNLSSGKGSVPDGTSPLPLSWVVISLLAFTFHRKFSRFLVRAHSQDIYYWFEFWRLLIQNYIRIYRCQWVNDDVINQHFGSMDKFSSILGYQGPILLIRINIILSWISNYIYYWAWNEITYSFSSVDGAAMLRNRSVVSHTFTGYVIT